MSDVSNETDVYVFVQMYMYFTTDLGQRPVYVEKGISLSSILIYCWRIYNCFLNLNVEKGARICEHDKIVQ